MAVANENSTTIESEKDRAQTPAWFIKSLEKLLDRKIDMDVCCSENTAKAEVYYALDEGVDCLKEQWVADWQEYKEEDFVYPLAYCNPPFSNIMPFLEKIVEQVGIGADVAVMLPNNPEVAYVRYAKEHAMTIIEMPFRLKFLRPDGTKFLNKYDKEQSPKFSCLIAYFTKYGLCNSTKHTYHDFRVGFKDA
jgi:phage N-6-adenine-methyltransferase